MESNKELVSNEFEIAPTSKRLLAYLIDIVPLVLLVSIVSYFFFGFDEIIRDRLINQDSRMKFLLARNNIPDISFLIFVFYSLFADSSKFQGTFGKKIMGLKVVNEDGSKISIQTSAIRNLFKIISFLALYIGFIWIFFNKKRKGWHDIIAKTKVVKA